MITKANGGLHLADILKQWYVARSCVKLQVRKYLVSSVCKENASEDRSQRCIVWVKEAYAFSIDLELFCCKTGHGKL